MRTNNYHLEIAQLLPWLVNNSLTEKERERVQAHLLNCGQCRLERDRLQELQLLVAEEDVKVPAYQDSFGRLMARIDQSELEREYNVTPIRSSRFRASATWLIPIGLAASVFGYTLLPSNVSQPDSAAFRTLTSDSASPGFPVTRQVLLTMEADATVMGLRQVLVDTESTIVSGPDENHQYTLKLSVSDSVSDQALISRLESMQGVKNVVFPQN